MKILIAEDDLISRKVLRHTLQQLGHEVVVATDGAEAWEMFNREPTRIVVSDWMMPNLDGLELCKRIRDRPHTPYTFFVILTAAHNTSAEYSLAMNSGIDDFLGKPLDREMLRTRLHMAERILRFTTEISLLQDLIPICSYCQKVRDGEDFWQRVDSYIQARTGSSFTHGICPECFDEQTRLLERALAESPRTHLAHSHDPSSVPER